jgi:hypothetical protein
MKHAGKKNTKESKYEKKIMIMQLDTTMTRRNRVQRANHDLPILRPPNTEAAAGVRANALGRDIDLSTGSWFW